ncbi:MAG: hypothetical protein KAH97_06115 [Anaerolineales bacterium]|nr:hypothetical protein [Anaerolineales bacterium]
MPIASSKSENHIGTLNEKPLHSALKAWYSQPKDEIEVKVNGYIIDIKRGELLIEIQSKNVSGIKRKISELTQQYQLRLLLPIPKEKWIIRLDESGSNQISRRKSPKRCSFLDLFSELVSIPSLINNENFSMDVVLIQEEEIRQYEDGRAWRRRGWVTQERRLLNVIEHRTFATKEDLAALLPDHVPDPFTTADLVENLSITRRLAQQMSYCLRLAEVTDLVGRRKRFKLYTRKIHS